MKKKKQRDVEATLDGPESPAVPDSPSPERCASLIAMDELPQRPLPMVDGLRATRFQVVVKRSVLTDIRRHGESSNEVEVCGVLVGNVYRDRAGPYLYVEANIRGDFASNLTAQVTFTAQTWEHIQEVMEKQHARQKILGWYHTHPGFGIFLSQMDLFIHENFFNFPWQVAFVHDPKSGEQGMFVWRKGIPEREPFLVEEDAPAASAPGQASGGGAAAISDEAIQQLTARIASLERRHRALLIGVALLALIFLAWPLVLYTVMNDNRPAGPMMLPPAIKPGNQPAPSTGAPPSTQPGALQPGAARTGRADPGFNLPAQSVTRARAGRGRAGGTLAIHPDPHVILPIKQV